MFRRGKWDLPKGKTDRGESLKDAALRETMEETGIRRLKIIRKIKFGEGKQGCTYHSYFLQGKRTLKETHWYKMTSDDPGPLVPQLDEGITKVGWYNKAEVKQNLRNSYQLINWVLDESGFSNR